MAGHKILEKVRLMASQAIAASGTKYSTPLEFEEATGEISILVVNEGTAVTITQQCSSDNTTFYDPVNYASATQGSVIANLTTTTGSFITFSPVLCKYSRFKAVATDHNSTTVTLDAFVLKEV